MSAISSRIRVHYTDSAQEALDLANRSYERLLQNSPNAARLSILLNQRDAIREDMERERRKSGTPDKDLPDRSSQMVIPRQKDSASAVAHQQTHPAHDQAETDQ